VLLARRAGADDLIHEVVIKRILPDRACEQEFIDMFRDEARITALLRHGNIVQVIEFGQEGNEYYLVLEYVDGTSLAKILKVLKLGKRRLPHLVVAFVLSEVARALDYAHRKRGQDGTPLGIIHRDVSPSNMVVSRDGEVKLTDFGIARAEERLVSTRGRGIKGKLSYMAPEMIENRPEPRSDLFALGAVGWEMCTGTPPFEADSIGARVGRIMSEITPPVSRLVPEVPRAISEIIESLLEKDPAARPARAGEVVDALAPALSSATRPVVEMMAEIVREACTDAVARPSIIPTRLSRPTGEMRLRAVVVEQSATARALLRSAIGQSLELVEVDTAEAALKAMAEGGVVLLLSQQRLPGSLSGIDLCRRVRASALHVGTPFLLVVATAEPELVATAHEAGVTQVIEKTDPRRLIGKVREHVTEIRRRFMNG
jgi:CheY-like chemotaxis protein